jgi:hypothetical protein
MITPIRWRTSRELFIECDFHGSGPGYGFDWSAELVKIVGATAAAVTVFGEELT